MKVIKINNGEKRIGYEFKDLGEDAMRNVINWYINTDIEIMNGMDKPEEHPFYEAVEESDKMQTPWFLGEIIWEKFEREILESIAINEYLFDEEGEVLPITYHVNGGHVIKTTFKNKECEVIEQ